MKICLRASIPLFKNCFFFFLDAWVSIAAHGLSLVVGSGATLGRDARLLSVVATRAAKLGAGAAVVVAHGLRSRSSRALEFWSSSCGAQA